jgi:hypothetical protein
MSDKFQQSDEKLQAMFRQMSKHLQSFRLQTVGAQNDLAHEYARSNNPATRQTYLDVEKRLAVIDEIGTVMMKDNLLTQDTKSVILLSFPNLSEGPQQQKPAGAPAPVAAKPAEAAKAA